MVQQYIIVPELGKRRPPNKSVSHQGTYHNILEKVQIKLGATVCHMEANEYNQPLWVEALFSGKKKGKVYYIIDKQVQL